MPMSGIVRNCETSKKSAGKGMRMEGESLPFNVVSCPIIYLIPEYYCVSSENARNESANSTESCTSRRYP